MVRLRVKNIVVLHALLQLVITVHPRDDSCVGMPPGLMLCKCGQSLRVQRLTALSATVLAPGCPCSAQNSEMLIHLLIEHHCDGRVHGMICFRLAEQMQHIADQSIFPRWRLLKGTVDRVVTDDAK